jgi:hypothetical protein
MAKENNVELRMELAQTMIDSWNRENLVTFAWDRLVDELGELNPQSLDQLCEQFDIENIDNSERDKISKIKDSSIYDKDDPRSVVDQFYDNPYNGNPE